MIPFASSMARRGPRRWVGKAVLGAAATLLLCTGAAGQTITVSTAQGATAAIGETFDIPVTIDMSLHGGLLGSFNLILRWDPATLTFLGGTPGTFGDVTANEDSILTGAIFLAGANPAGAGGLVTVGTARFTPLVLDTATFDITVTELYEAGSFADLLPLVNVVSRQFCPGRGRYGDINGDGQSNSADALIALNNAVGLPTTGDLLLGDVDADGDTDPRDALVMISSGAGLDVSRFRLGTLAPGNTCAPAGGLTTGITPDTVTVLTGQSIQFTVSRVDTAGVPVAASNVSYASSDPAVATVDSAGVMVAVAPGTVTIDALQDSTVSVSATVTVVADRRVHWVDGLALNEVNRIGTRQWPFSDVNDAVAFSTPGDTIMVRPGTYPEGIQLTQPVVLMGDTASGRRPFITATQRFGSGITVTAPGNVELHHLDVDTMYVGVLVTAADTILVRDVSFVSNPNSFASLFLDSATATRIVNSRFYGDVIRGFGGNTAIYVTASSFFAMDSVVISNYGDFGIEAYGIDTLDIRRSTVRDNYNYGLYYWRGDSTRALSAVLEDNRISGHPSGSFYLRTVRNVSLRNNVFEGGNGAGNYIEGYSAARVTIRGDSVLSNVNLSQFQAYELFRVDSAHIDSITALGQAGRISMNDVRSAVVRDSDFLTGSFSYTIASVGFTGGLFSDHRLKVRNVTMEGPDSTTCVRCGYGFYIQNVKADLDSVTARRMSLASYFVDSASTVNHFTLDDFSTGILTSCAGLNVTNLVANGGQVVVDVNGGCKSGDSVFVDNLVADKIQYGVDSRSTPLTVTNSAFTNVSSFGVQQIDSGATITDNVVELTGTLYGIYVDANGSSTPYLIERNRVDCSQAPVVGATGVYVNDGVFVVRADTVLGCFYGIRAIVNTPAVQDISIRGNYIAMRSTDDYGVLAQGTHGRYEVVGNTIVGGAPVGPDYGISVESPSGRYLRVDSNTVDRFTLAGVLGGRADTLLIRDNTLLNQVAGTSSASGVSGAAGIVQGVSTDSSHVVEIRRNRIANSGRSGILIGRDHGVDSVLVLVDSNTVKDVAEYGIGIQAFTNAWLRYNAIDGAGLDAMQFSRTSLVKFRDTVFVDFNNVMNSGRFGMQNVFPADVILADNNWWNHTLGPSGFFGNQGSTGDSVSANVVWVPALTAPANAPIPTAPPAFSVSLERLGAPVAGAAVSTAPVTDATPRPLTARRDRRMPAGVEAAAAGGRVVGPASPDGPAWVQRLRQLEAARATWHEQERQRDEARARRQARDPRVTGRSPGGSP